MTAACYRLQKNVNKQSRDGGGEIEQEAERGKEITTSSGNCGTDLNNFHLTKYPPSPSPAW